MTWEWLALAGLAVVAGVLLFALVVLRRGTRRQIEAARGEAAELRLRLDRLEQQRPPGGAAPEYRITGVGGFETGASAPSSTTGGDGVRSSSTAGGDGVRPSSTAGGDGVRPSSTTGGDGVRSSGTSETAAGRAVEAVRLERAVFADHLLREGVIRMGSLAHGVRRALNAETRNRVRFEMRREIKRARRERRAEQREAQREWQQRQRDVA